MSGVTFISKTGTPTPVGTIVLWYGSKASIPVGWALYSAAAGYWVKGALVANTTPQNTNDIHVHTYSSSTGAVPNHNHPVSATSGLKINEVSPQYFSGGVINTYWAIREHIHSVINLIVSMAGGHSHPLSATGSASVKPPSVGLFYIRKVS